MIETETMSRVGTDNKTVTPRWGVDGPLNRAERFPGFAGIEEWEQFAVRTEECGADFFCTGEAPTVFEDSFVYLAAAARVTKTIKLGHATMVPSIRHPAVLASSFSTIQRLSDGRAFNGIGTGAVGLRDLGMPPAKLADFERYCVAVTDLTAGEEVTWEGKKIRMKWSAGRVPLYLGAEGPRALELVGKIADGAIVGTGLSPDVIEFVNDHIAEGSSVVGRQAADVDVWYQTRVHLSDTVESGLHVFAVEQYLARWLNHIWLYSQRDKSLSTAENLRRQRGINIDHDLGERLRMFNEEYSQDAANAGRYDRNADHNVQLMDKYDLRYTLGPYCWVTGSHDDAVKRFQELIDAGAHNFNCVQYPDDRMRTITELGNIFAALR